MTREANGGAGAAAVALLMTLIALMTATQAMAQASAFTQISSSAFGPTVVTSTCTGESITIQGTLRSLIHVTFDPTGGGHFRFSTGQHGTGTGTTGAHYTLATTSGSEANFPGTAFAFTIEVNSLLVTPGPTNNQTLHSTAHVTFDANGNFSSMVDNFRADCQ
jgi:hypothetical protein